MISKDSIFCEVGWGSWVTPSSALVPLLALHRESLLMVLRGSYICDGWGQTGVGLMEGKHFNPYTISLVLISYHFNSDYRNK